MSRSKRMGGQEPEEGKAEKGGTKTRSNGHICTGRPNAKDGPGR